MTTATAIREVRERYAADIVRQARRSGCEASRVEAAFARVPRECCLTAPPWRVFSPGGLFARQTSDPRDLYDDVLVVLDRKRGINNGQPTLHAAWMTAVAPKRGETVVQVGAGSGYYTAILAELAGSLGRIEAYEVDPALAMIAQKNTAPWPQARVLAESGSNVIPDADVIYVSAALAAPPASWLRALRPRGRLIFPWQPGEGGGTTLLVRRTCAGFSAEGLFAVRFIPCIGALAGRRHIEAADLHRVRSVRLSTERRPDDSAVAIFDEVWFSAAEPG